MQHTPNHQVNNCDRVRLRITLPDPLLEQVQALGGLDTATPERPDELGSIRDTRVTLPTSYILPPHLLNTCSLPLASGAYGDVYEGSLNGSKVCVKRIRVYTRGVQQKVAEVHCHVIFPHSL